MKTESRYDQYTFPTGVFMTERERDGVSGRWRVPYYQFQTIQETAVFHGLPKKTIADGKWWYNVDMDTREILKQFNENPPTKEELSAPFLAIREALRSNHND